jgi:hypothetical protein
MLCGKYTRRAYLHASVGVLALAAAAHVGNVALVDVHASLAGTVDVVARVAVAAVGAVEVFARAVAANARILSALVDV